ncbi:MAG: metal ABC transporter permease [Anaerolineales bacterium]|nr:MAG: metal ABC transporter permease [Anaerolineales bacterium]
MVEWLLEPLGYAFMQRGFLAAVVVGVVCALVGCYMILRGMAFLGDALGHATLPGLAVGYLVSNGDRSGSFFWALGTAVLTSVVMGALSRNTKLRHDTAIGIVFAGMFALGIAIISSIRSYAVDLTHMLFGNILGVTTGDIWLVLAVSLVVLLAITFFYKELLVVSFDPVLAVTLRLPVRALDVLLHVLIALAIVASLQTVGIALVVAMLVTPAATAFLLTKRLKRMMVMAAGLAAFSGVAGLYTSYYLSIASGAAIVLVSTFLFVLVYLFRNALPTARRVETKSPAH